MYKRQDLEERLSRLAEKTDEIIPKVLEAGGEVVLSKVRSNLSSIVGQGTKEESRSTGELERSLGLSPAKQKRDGSGWDVKVGFAEPRSCLLYTSDAADDLPCVDLGGRRIIKKKTTDTTK
mgnify:CR=1 FL=1